MSTVRHASPVDSNDIVARLVPVRQIRSRLDSAISGLVAEISLTDVACTYL